MKDNILLALTALKANKMRSLLTMLGIIIGIASVIAINTIGDSMMNYINSTMNGMGASNINVYITKKDNNPLMPSFMFGPSNPSEKDLINDEMIEYVSHELNDQIESIAISESVGSTLLEDKEDQKYNLSIYGVNTAQKSIDGLTIVTGRFIENDDTTKICVISQDIANTFYKDTNPLGQTLYLTINGNKVPFYIAGVYTSQSNTAAMSMLMSGIHSSNVYIPISVAKKLTYAMDGYQSLTIVPKLGINSNLLMNEVKSVFNQFYTRNEAYQVDTLSMESMLSSMNDMMATLQIAIACIAAISLLVGGIDVMNIMLVSITERTREIGTRVALGAKGFDIRLQFIVESIIICLIGGIIGILLGIGLASIGTNLLGFAVTPSLHSCLMAVMFSMVIGIFFGYYPANKAAKLNPIDALRYE